MDDWSLTELKQIIHEDIEEFMGDGLDIRQASSRVQVEYARLIDASQLNKLVIYMVLCDEGIKHGYVRDDIKNSALQLLREFSFDDCAWHHKEHLIK